MIFFFQQGNGYKSIPRPAVRINADKWFRINLSTKIRFCLTPSKITVICLL
jgi:hypothetical protein